MTLKFSSFAVVITALLLFSCNPTKKLPPGQRLYVGAKVVIDSLPKREAGDLTAELKALARPKPNSSVFGIRYGIFFWNLVDTPKKRGVRSFLKRKYGEAPVIGSDVNLEKNREVMVSRLFNRGYYRAVVEAKADTPSDNRFLTAVYTATPGPLYKIRNVRFPQGEDSLSRDIRRLSARSRLKTGKPYNLDVIKAERDRIDQRLKNKGYFYFSPESLIIEVDSTVGANEVDLYVKIKEDWPEKALEQYRLRNITVYPNFDFEESLQGDTTGDIATARKTKEGYFIADPENKYRDIVFSKTLVFKPGDLYNRRDHNTSLNRLVSLGAFKYVKAEFNDADTTAGNFLDVDYYATPMPKKGFRAEITGLTRSNNSTGSELSISFRNRNTFRGAELFTLSAFGGLESQIYGQQNVATVRYGAEANVYVPRIISPFRINTLGDFVPQTRFSLGYEHFYRNDQYSLNSAKATYGYQWKPDLLREQQLTLLNVNVVDSSQVTDSFRKLIALNPTLQRSIQRQLIIGSIYNYNYNSNARPNRKRHNFYFNGNADLAGNLLGAVLGTSGGDKQVEIAGIPFSQYVRGELEGRHYWKLNNRSREKDITLASRLLAGAGYAYGNRLEMPFIKQFFSGGVNSVRAFRARSIGPGTYYGGALPSSTGGTVFLADQPGDVRLEANTELRFPIYSIVKGAVFVDAGNVWTVRDDPNRPGSKLTPDFLSQLAVGAGAGLRFDISFLVIRVDLATPLRKPYELVPAEERFNFKDVNYRRQNLILNLAIGYPF